MDYSLMFLVEEGGVSTPISWGKQNLQSDKNIIVLDEGSSSLFLWHGAKQGLVARRTALRQAESLKGHGYSAGKSIIGRDLKKLKEIDERKIGRDPETDKLYEELQDILNREYKELDNYIVIFDMKDIGISAPKHVAIPKVSPEPILPPKPEPILPPQPETPVKQKSEIGIKEQSQVVQKKEMVSASEYDMEPVIIKTETHEEIPKIPLSKEPPAQPKVAVIKTTDLPMQAKIGFVFMGILDFFDDIWISKKKDGTYSVEHMDGKVCEFSVEEGKIKFSVNSFSGISTNIKTDIQKKFVELSKLL
jgi:hypothetical protein